MEYDLSNQVFLFGLNNKWQRKVKVKLHFANQHCQRTLKHTVLHAYMHTVPPKAYTKAQRHTHTCSTRVIMQVCKIEEEKKHTVNSFFFVQQLHPSFDGFLVRCCRKICVEFGFECRIQFLWRRHQIFHWSYTHFLNSERQYQKCQASSNTKSMAKKCIFIKHQWCFFFFSNSYSFSRRKTEMEKKTHHSPTSFLFL